MNRCTRTVLRFDPSPALILVAVLGFWLRACSTTRPPLRIETADHADAAPRRAPGVAVDPAPELPAPLASAPTEQSVVVLRAPTELGIAREVVKKFFRAVVEESIEELDALLSEQAWVRASAGQRQPARAAWRARLIRLDYGVLAGEPVYRDREFETYRGRDLGRTHARRNLPLTASRDEVVVRVPVVVGQGSRNRLFGDELVFLLRPEGKSYKIAEIVEDFQLP